MLEEFHLESESIGIVTPYIGQVNLIRKLFQNEEKINPEISSVDSY